MPGYSADKGLLRRMAEFPTEYVDCDIELDAEYKHWITTLSSVETNEHGTLSRSCRGKVYG